MEEQAGTTNLFDTLSEEIVFSIIDRLEDDPLDKKSFSLVCKSFRFIESKHRKTLTLIRPSFLAKILRRYPSIAHLDLTDCPRVLDKNLTAISTAYESTLQSIDLSGSSLYTQVGLSALIRNCTALVEIDLSNATWLRDSAGSKIAEAKNLEKLWLADCKWVSDGVVGCIAVGCKKLRLLSLKQCSGVSDLGVRYVGAMCKEMRHLDLSYLQITKKCLPSILQLEYLEKLFLVGCLAIDEGLATLKQGCKSLQVLDLSKFRDAGHACLSFLTSDTDPEKRQHSFSGLQSLKLDGCWISSSGMNAIANCCASLKKLKLHSCSGVTDEGLSSIVQKHGVLRRLDITGCDRVSNVSIDCITSSCTSLTSLKMESCSWVSEEAFLLIGQHCLILEKLNITNTDINDEGLKSISKCSKLSKLRVGHCHITDHGISHVGMCCPNLTWLEFPRCTAITDVSIAAIANGCPALKFLHVSYCHKITDNSLISLSKCSRLVGLRIRGCTCVSSVGLSAIAVGCRQLLGVDIKKCCNINDIGMHMLAKYSQNLTLIYLTFCSVTDVGFLALASISRLRHVALAHKAFLTPNGVATALLTFRGLADVELNTFFQASLNRHLIQNMEARGCVFNWKNRFWLPTECVHIVPPPFRTTDQEVSDLNYEDEDDFDSFTSDSDDSASLLVSAGT